MKNNLSGQERNLDSKKLFEQTNEKIEYWSQIVYVIFVKLLLPVFMLPQFSIGLFNYFTTDLGNDALEMIFPVW